MTKTQILQVDPRAPDERTVKFAATLLQNGKLVAFPTETVYGIGANVHNAEALQRLCEIKKRPKGKPFTIHISNIDTITAMKCEVSPFAARLMKEFWPGPLTLILKSVEGKLGFRMPQNAIAKAVIARSTAPLAVPSANISGERPPTEAAEIAETLGEKIDLILDGGKTEYGKESTIVDSAQFPYKIIRHGAIPEEKIAGVWNEFS
jgi:L-threonylcarbamoyladenylate synthase